MLKKIARFAKNQAHKALFAAAFVPLAETPPGSKLSTIYSSTADLSGFINGLFKFAIAIGAIAAVLRIAYAGYLYMGQSDMWSHKGQAKTILADVTLGLLLLMAVWLILNQINPDILSLNALKNVTPATQMEAPPASAGNAGGFLSPNQDPSLIGCDSSGCGN